MLELILFQVECWFRKLNQPYLESLFKALFALGYYGLLRVGELTKSDHVIRAKNMSLATNKKKILIILYSSKTHLPGNKPQKIHIIANNDEKSGKYRNRHFCPFDLITDYIAMCGLDIESDEEQFFIYRDKSPILPAQASNLLKEMIKKLRLDPSLYGMHSLRIGRTTDLIKFGYSIDEVRRMGRWKSNAVFTYIRS